MAAGKGILLEPAEIKVKDKHIPKIDNENMESVEVSPITKVTTEEIMEFLR